MIIDLSGKTAIVTGSTGGIGLAIATGLATAGAQVTMVGRDQERVNAAVAKVHAVTGRDNARGVTCDPGTPEGIATLIAAQPETDILVNGLGIYGAREFFDIEDALWETYFQVNIMSGDNERLSAGVQFIEHLHDLL